MNRLKIRNIIKYLTVSGCLLSTDCLYGALPGWIPGRGGAKAKSDMETWHQSYYVIVDDGREVIKISREIFDRGGTIGTWHHFYYAITNNDWDVMRILLDRKADVNVQWREGETPLHIAAWCGQVGFMEVLLDQNGNVNARNNLGETPLYVAVRRGDEQVVRMLLDRGADVNAKNNNGYRPLDVAGDEVIANLLKSRGAKNGINFSKADSPIDV
jgi:hypothetical protein